MRATKTIGTQLSVSMRPNAAGSRMASLGALEGHTHARSFAIIPNPPPRVATPTETIPGHHAEDAKP